VKKNASARFNIQIFFFNKQQMNMNFFQSQPLLIPCALAYLGLLLDLIGTAMIGNGGVYWFYFFLYLLTNTLVLYVSRVNGLIRDLQLIQLSALLLSLAYMPSEIAAAITLSSIPVISNGFGLDPTTGRIIGQNNNLSSGGSVKAAGLIITILMMFVQLVIVAVPHKHLGLAPVEHVKEEKEMTVVEVAP
jgi:hypothetical protein